jgi:DUF4097 and DUF4098 domain-containing protein YvlB
LRETDEPAGSPPKIEKTKKNDRHVSATEVLTKSFKTGASPRLIVELQNGAIEITAAAENAIDAQVTKEAKAETKVIAQEALKSIDVKMTQEEGVVRITAREPRQEHSGVQAAASAILRVPSGTTLNLQTANGAVRVTGVSGAARIQSANGSIHVKDCKSALDLQTTNGAVHALGGAGQLKVNTVNGSVHVQGTKAVVTARSANGGLHFEGTLAEGQQTFDTDNGSIVVSLPSNAHFRVEAQTHHGRVTSEFAIVSEEGKARNRLKGRVGDETSTVLKLHTQNGSIMLKKQMPADKKSD